MAAKEIDSHDAAPAASGLTTKKLVLILAVAVAVLIAGVGAAVLIVAKRAAADAAAEATASDEEREAEQAARRRAERSSHPPVFVPLDPFVVNLTDRQQDRYAQIGITLEIEDAKFGDELKTYMPAIRNGILMILAHKSSQELLEREGKEALAEEIMAEIVRPMGREAGSDGPVRAVHYSTFIIQ